jgi:hypothetical protein
LVPDHAPAAEHALAFEDDQDISTVEPTIIDEDELVNEFIIAATRAGGVTPPPPPPPPPQEVIKSIETIAYKNLDFILFPIKYDSLAIQRC